LKKQNKNSSWPDFPDYYLEIAPCDQQIQVMFNKTIIADSKKTLILKESDYQPLYYFPREDIRMNYLEKTPKISFCPFKGEANHWSLTVNKLKIEIAAWSYESPFNEVTAIDKYITFYPEAIDKLIII